MPDFDIFGNQRVACKIDMVSRLDDVFHCPYHRGQTIQRPTIEAKPELSFPSGKPEFSILRN